MNMMHVIINPQFNEYFMGGPDRGHDEDMTPEVFKPLAPGGKPPATPVNEPCYSTMATDDSFLFVPPVPTSPPLPVASQVRHFEPSPYALPACPPRPAIESGPPPVVLKPAPSLPPLITPPRPGSSFSGDHPRTVRIQQLPAPPPPGRGNVMQIIEDSRSNRPTLAQMTVAPAPMPPEEMPEQETTILSLADLDKIPSNWSSCRFTRTNGGGIGLPLNNAGRLWGYGIEQRDFPGYHLVRAKNFSGTEAERHRNIRAIVKLLLKKDENLCAVFTNTEELPPH